MDANINKLQSDILDAIGKGENIDLVVAKYNKIVEQELLPDFKFDKLKLKFENKSNNPDPEYACTGDSGFDLRAFIDKPITIGPLERAIVKTGLFFEIPEGYEVQVRPRSGLAAKKGITVLNTPGTVDAGYRGEVMIILVNLSTEPFTINTGERIAQAVFNNVANSTLTELVKIKEVSTDTERGAGGLGHTGVE